MSPTVLSRDAQRTLDQYSVLSGLCPLIPVPFLDDLVEHFVTRRMVTQMFADHELSPSSKQIATLTRNRHGCSIGCLFAIAVYPIKKVFKKILFIFAIRSSINVASVWFHRGYLIAVALRDGQIDQTTLNEPNGIWPVALAIEETLIETDTGPILRIITSIFTGSHDILKSASKKLRRLFKKERRTHTPVKLYSGDESEFQDVVSELADRVWAEDRYLVSLESQFLAILAQTHTRIHGENNPISTH